MRKILRICLVCVFLFAYSALCAQDKQSYDSTTDYILKTQRLWGISEVRVNEDGTVTLTDAKNSGYGYALFVPDGKGGFLEQITLSPGQSFELTDGHHAFITYKFVKVEKDKIIFAVTDKFDARAFGDKVRIETKEVTVTPYAIE